MNQETRALAARALMLVRSYGEIRRLTDQRYNKALEKGPIENPSLIFAEEDEALARIRGLADHLSFESPMSLEEQADNKPSKREEDEEKGQ